MDPHHLLTLATALKALRSWDCLWPPEQLLGNPQALISLDRLLGKVLHIARHRESLGRFESDASVVILDTVAYLGFFLRTVVLLPGYQSLHTLTTLPPTFLSHILYMVDEQLLGIAGSDNLEFVCNIVNAVELCLIRCMDVGSQAETILVPALLGLSKFILAALVSGRMRELAGETLTPAVAQKLENQALSFLFQASQLAWSQGGSPVSEQSALKALASEHTPTISETRYVRVLCQVAASRTERGSDIKHGTFANSLIAQAIRGSSSANGGVVVVAESQASALPLLLMFLSRTAQQQMKPARQLQLQLKRRQKASDAGLMEAEDGVMQLVLLDVCNIVMALTGESTAQRYPQGAMALHGFSSSPHDE